MDGSKKTVQRLVYITAPRLRPQQVAHAAEIARPPQRVHELLHRYDLRRRGSPDGREDVARHGFWQWAVGRAMNTNPVDNGIDIYYRDINSVVNN